MSSIRTSKQVSTLLTAVNKGYRVDDGGNVISPFSFKFRKLSISIGSKRGLPYYRFNIGVANCEIRPVLVHQLQAYQKFGDEVIKIGVYVRHLDGNSLNNSLSNIAIGSAFDNTMDIPEDVRLFSATTAATAIRKFTDVEMEEIRRLYEKVRSYKHVMEMYDISSKGTLNYILNNKYVTVK